MKRLINFFALDMTPLLRISAIGSWHQDHVVYVGPRRVHNIPIGKDVRSTTTNKEELGQSYS